MPNRARKSILELKFDLQHDLIFDETNNLSYAESPAHKGAESLRIYL